jgi:hypothetical protein
VRRHDARHARGGSSLEPQRVASDSFHSRLEGKQEAYRRFRDRSVLTRFAERPFENGGDHSVRPFGVRSGVVSGKRACKQATRRTDQLMNGQRAAMSAAFPCQTGAAVGLRVQDSRCDP